MQWGTGRCCVSGWPSLAQGCVSHTEPLVSGSGRGPLSSCHVLVHTGALRHISDTAQMLPKGTWGQPGMTVPLCLLQKRDFCSRLAADRTPILAYPPGRHSNRAGGASCAFPRLLDVLLLSGQLRSFPSQRKTMERGEGPQQVPAEEQQPMDALGRGGRSAPGWLAGEPGLSLLRLCAQCTARPEQKSSCLLLS